MAVRWDWWIDRVEKRLEQRELYLLRVGVAAIRWDKVESEVDNVLAARGFGGLPWDQEKLEVMDYGSTAVDDSTTWHSPTPRRPHG